MDTILYLWSECWIIWGCSVCITLQLTFKIGQTVKMMQLEIVLVQKSLLIYIKGMSQELLVKVARGAISLPPGLMPNNSSVVLWSMLKCAACQIQFGAHCYTYQHVVSLLRTIALKIQQHSNSGSIWRMFLAFYFYSIRNSHLLQKRGMPLQILLQVQICDSSLTLVST